MPLFHSQFQGQLFLWHGDKASWRFIALPAEVSEEIDHLSVGFKRGFGSLPVQVTIGQTSWQTSIFPDKKRGVYLLPVKKAVREAENIDSGDSVTVALVI